MLTGCTVKGNAVKEIETPFEINKNPYPSTYETPTAAPVLITNADILTGNGEFIKGGSILLNGGKIAAIGADIVPPQDAWRIDARGKWVTPGLIDVHSHIGDYAAPAIKANADGNEISNPVTAEVWAEHSIWPGDPQFNLALRGGVTTLQVLPGSANLFGGRGVTLKNVRSRTVQGMKFPAAPYSLKMACGENPKRVYGERKKAPSTRMGNVAGYRKAWIKAREYQRKWDKYYKNTEKKPDDEKKNEPPARDLANETLAGVLKGEILVHNHCYRADEMAVMLDVAKEFGYKVTAFHHAVESYKIADLLAVHGVCSAMWADWWGFKLEAFDGIEENVALVHNAGACAIVHSDSAEGIQRLNQEAAKAMTAGNRIGLDIDRATAIQWITINPAKALGIDHRTGSLETEKMADVIIWDGDPFSVYTRTEKVFIDGVLVWDSQNTDYQPHSDFELGLTKPRELRP